MFKLNLVTPEKKIVADQELEEIVLPAYRGELNILPGHSPLLTTLLPGILKYKLKSGVSGKLAIGWGYCQVSREGVNVLAETAVESNEVNVQADKDQLKQQENKLVNQFLTDAEWDHTQTEISRLKAELNLAQGPQK